MSNEEKLRQHLIEVEVYEVFQCAMNNLMKDQIAAKAASTPSTTSKPITQISQPKPISSNETKDLPKGTIMKRAVKWTSIERMKMNLKKGKNMWTQRDKQATKEALNTLMSQIGNKIIEMAYIVNTLCIYITKYWNNFKALIVF